MKLTKLLFGIAISASVGFIGCKPKDADIQKAVQEKVSAGITVSVTDAIVTLNGAVPDDASKTAAGTIASGVKGVKSVTNDISVTAPPPPPVAPAPVVISPDDSLSLAVRDVTKDYPTVAAAVKDGVVSVTGQITKDKWKKLKMSLDGLKPKKVDGSALTIQ